MEISPSGVCFLSHQKHLWYFQKSKDILKHNSSSLYLKSCPSILITLYQLMFVMIMWIVLMELMKTSVLVKSICSMILRNMEIIAWMFPIFKDGSRPLPKPVPIIVSMPKISNVNLSITTLPKVFVSWTNWTLDWLEN